MTKNTLKNKHKIDYQEVVSAGKALSKEVMVVMLNGGAHKELIDAHARWKDAIDGAPNWGITCTKKQKTKNYE